MEEDGMEMRNEWRCGMKEDVQWKWREIPSFIIYIHRASFAFGVKELQKILGLFQLSGFERGGGTPRILGLLFTYIYI